MKRPRNPKDAPDLQPIALPEGADIGGSLIAPLNALTDTINALVGGIGEINKQIRRSKTVTRLLAISLFVDVVLTLVLGFVVHQVDSNSYRIGTIQNRTSTQVLCPLYLLFDQSLAAPRAKGVTDAQWREVLHYRVVLKRATDALHCPPTLSASLAAKP